MSEEVQAAPAGKKGRLKLVVLLVAVLLFLGGGGAGAYWWMSRGAGGDDAADHAEPAHESKAKAVTLPTFTVNLADRDASRYLRTTVALIVSDEKLAAELEGGEHGGGAVKLMKARSSILELLATQTADKVTTAEGKEALKKEIAQRASQAFGTKVSDVLFSEFVVQF